MPAFPFLKREKKKKEIKGEFQEAKGIAQLEQAKSSAKKALVSLLKEPRISERATKLSEKRQYVFIVRKNATKPEIKKVVEQSFSVTANKVHILNLPGKVKRLGRQEGFRPGYKKAIVTLRKGDKIEFG